MNRKICGFFWLKASFFVLLFKIRAMNFFFFKYHCTIFFFNFYSFKKTTHQLLLLHRPGGFVNILQVTTTYYLLNIFCFSSRFIINDFAKQNQKKKNLLFVFSHNFLFFFCFKRKTAYLPTIQPNNHRSDILVYYNWGLNWRSN